MFTFRAWSSGIISIRCSDIPAMHRNKREKPVVYGIKWPSILQDFLKMMLPALTGSMADYCIKKEARNDQKTDDTATSPGEKRKQANKENKPEPSKVALKRKKSGLPEDVPDEGPEAAKKDEGSAAAPAPSPSKSDPIPAEPAAATTTQEEQALQHSVPTAAMQQC
ncbi:hypothetical protein WJX77_004361 [Trebouxia sp. C0004]